MLIHRPTAPAAYDAAAGVYMPTATAPYSCKLLLAASLTPLLHRHTRVLLEPTATCTAPITTPMLLQHAGQSV
jgi:hypothetical protein